MELAELIVRTLDATASHYAEDNEHPVIGKYSKLCLEKYKELKRTKDFQTAGREAKTWIVGKILDNRP